MLFLKVLEALSFVDKICKEGLSFVTEVINRVKLVFWQFKG